jgi:hypothetical protein
LVAVASDWNVAASVLKRPVTLAAVGDSCSSLRPGHGRSGGGQAGDIALGEG